MFRIGTNHKLRELHEPLIREQKEEDWSDWGCDFNGSKKGVHEQSLKSAIKEKQSGKAQSDTANTRKE
jgi:hypothetical protein